MRYLLFVPLLFLSLFLQASIITTPISLLILIVFYCFYQDEWIFFAAFLSGVILDIVLVQYVGITSGYFLICIFLISLYQRKFEVSSYYFLSLYIFFSTVFYAWIFSIRQPLLVAIMSSFIGIGYFWILRKLTSLEQRS